MVKKRGQPKQRHVPLRTCVACRETKPKRELVRVVLLPDGTIGVDETGKQNGRGAYLCRQHSCWQTALKQGSLKRALRMQPTPEALASLQAYAESLPVLIDEN
ncbi:MAG: YlxR family protein [Anaerolineae bacterium]|nr:YlxR family protein [Anaerolineae bacterium]